MLDSPQIDILDAINRRLYETRQIKMKLLFLTILLAATATTARADAVKIQVNGPDGKPIAGARVRVQESSGSWMERKFEAPRELTSDANGAVNWESKFSLAPDPDQNRKDYGTQALARVDAPGVAAIGGAALRAGDNVITLSRATTLEGTVSDENQQPLAGARLQVTQLSSPLRDDNAADAPYASLRGALALETVSDAQGRWRLDNMPVGATASLEITALGFRKLKFSTPVAPGALPIFLRRGATVKGRILRPDGSGAANVQFLAGDAWDQPRTDAEGHFEVDGIKPGQVTLQIPMDAARLPFVLPGKPVQGLQAGEVRDVGDWKAGTGVRVRGRVVDGAGKPIAGAQVMVWGAGDGSGQADGKGAFDFVAEKGASMSTIYAEGYIAKQLSDVPDATNGVIDLGEITLKRGQKITGVLKNQAGAPVPYVALRATRNGNEMASARADANGKFSFDGLETGPYKIQSYNGKIVAGERFTLPAPDDKPLNVVIESKTPVGNSSVPLQVRVLDENGVGIAGAQVALRLQMGERSYSQYSAISDAQGALHGNILGTGDNLEITEIFRPGYSVGAGVLKLENGVWLGEIRVQARGQFLRGRVVDAAGGPLAGIAVGLNSGFDLPVATNENGEFALPDAPQVGATITASDGARLATFAVEKIGQKIEIQLPDAVLVDTVTLAEQILPRARFGYNLLDKWDVLGSARIESLALAVLDDGEGEGSGLLAWNQFLLKMARRDPARFVAREAALRERNPANNVEEFNDSARLARAAAGTRAQKVGVEEWLEAERKIKREISAENVTALLMRAEIAARLGDETGAQTWLDYAAQIGDYVPDRSNNSWEWGAAAARVGPEAASKLVENWTPVAQMQLLQSALAASVEIGDVAATESNWQRLQQLAVAAENAPPNEAPRVEGFVIKASDLLGRSRGKYPQLLSRTDPQAAFELAKDLSPDDVERMETMPIIGRNAARLGQFEVARAALLATFESSFGNTNYVANAAQTAATFDEKLADELFARVYAKSLPQRDWAGDYWTLSDYAAARADKWPGETRLLLEREWPARLANASKPRDADDRNYDGADQATIQLVGAMALVAPMRAIELAQQLPERKQLRAKAFASLLSALLKN